MKFVFVTAVVSALFLLLAPSVIPSRLIEHSSYLRHGHDHNHHGHRQHHHTRWLHTNTDNYIDVMTNTKTSFTEMSKKMATKEGKQSTIQVAGSRLPDCSNACGSCKPCKLVIVTFVCATLSEAESCPMAYKCMCRNKSYPVP